MKFTRFLNVITWSLLLAASVYLTTPEYTDSVITVIAWGVLSFLALMGWGNQIRRAKGELNETEKLNVKS